LLFGFRFAPDGKLDRVAHCTRSEGVISGNLSDRSLPITATFLVRVYSLSNACAAEEFLVARSASFLGQLRKASRLHHLQLALTTGGEVQN
jgi:hypothetical protein